MTLALIALSVLAAYLSRGTGLWVFAVANAVASVWSNGVMANYGRGDADEIPNWAATMSIGTTLLSVVFIVTALIVR